MTLDNTLSQKNPGKIYFTKSRLAHPKKVENFKNFSKFNRSFIPTQQWYFMTFKPDFDVFRTKLCGNTGKSKF